MRALFEIGALLTKEQQARFLNSLEHALEVADFISDDAPNTATQEVQKTQRADMDHQARAPWTCGRQVFCEWQNFYAKQTKRAGSGLRIKQQRLKSPPLPTILYTI